MKTKKIMIGIFCWLMVVMSIPFLGQTASAATVFVYDGTNANNYNNENIVYIRANVPSFTFAYKSNIQSVIVEEGVENISRSAFQGCYNLKDVKLPDSLIVIDEDAFSRAAITTITIPKNLQYLDKKAFSDCVSLSNIEVSAANPVYSSVDGILYNKAQTLLIQYPKSKYNTDFTIPETVKTIGEDAFRSNPYLVNVNISKNVELIEIRAFNGCNKLTTVTFTSNPITIKEYAFRGTNISKVELYDNAIYDYTSFDSTFSIILKPYITVSGIPDTWVNTATLTISGSVGSSISSITLEGSTYNFSEGQQPVIQFEAKRSGTYSIGVKTRKSSQTAIVQFEVKNIDGIPPSDVTYELVDNACVLKSTDNVYGRGLKGIYYRLNGSNEQTYKSPIQLEDGTNVIEAYAVDLNGNESYKKTFVMEVEDVERSITLNYQVKTLYKGSSFTLKATVKPSNLNNKTIKWKSGDSAIAKVSSTGKVTAVAPGTTTIRGIASNQQFAECVIIVQDKKPTITKSLTMKKWSTYTLKPKNIKKGYDVSYKSSKSSVVSVSKGGTLTANKTGAATITCKVVTPTETFYLTTKVSVR